MLPTNLKHCWNPDCGYALPIKARICTKCLWTVSGPFPAIKETAQVKVKAKPFTPTDGMNKQERAYYEHLERELLLGRVLWFQYEPMGLRIGHQTFWHPDFLVILPDSTIELHDVKARWKGQTRPHIEDDAQVKMRAIAHHLRWLTVAVVWREDGEWKRQDYK